METHTKYLHGYAYNKHKVNNKIDFRVKLPTVATITGDNNNQVQVNLYFRNNAVKTFHEAMSKKLISEFGSKYKFMTKTKGYSDLKFHGLNNMEYTFINKKDDTKNYINIKQNIDLNVNVTSNSPILVMEDDYEIIFEFGINIGDVSKELRSILGSKHETIKSGVVVRSKKGHSDHMVVLFHKPDEGKYHEKYGTVNNYWDE